MSQCILQTWVLELGIRHQGCLISAIRGCDSVPKNDPSRALVRCLREAVLNPACGDSKKAASFIEYVGEYELKHRMDEVVKNFDHYPVHYVLHLMHAAQIIGYYKLTGGFQTDMWLDFYMRMCKAMHLKPEGPDACEARLSANEDEFAKQQKV